jgi:hypothetical protein
MFPGDRPGTAPGDPVLVSRVDSSAGWGVLRGIVRGIAAEAPRIRELEADATRKDCPLCGTTLELVRGVRWCPFDGWRARR